MNDFEKSVTDSEEEIPQFDAATARAVRREMAEAAQSRLEAARKEALSLEKRLVPAEKAVAQFEEQLKAAIQERDKLRRELRGAKISAELAERSLKEWTESEVKDGSTIEKNVG